MLDTSARRGTDRCFAARGLRDVVKMANGEATRGRSAAAPLKPDHREKARRSGLVAICSLDASLVLQPMCANAAMAA